jgi:hypothetical protein
MRRIAAGLAGLALALVRVAALPASGSAGIIETNCSTAVGDVQFNFAEGLLAGDKDSAWLLFRPGSGDYESSTFDAAKLKAGKVTFTDRTGIQLDDAGGGDQNVEAKLKGKLSGDAEAFTVKLTLKDRTGGEKFKLEADGSCKGKP